MPFTSADITEQLSESIAEMLSYILKQSMGCNGIRIAPNTIITLDNCPQKYNGLFKILLELKQINQTP